MQWGGPWLAQRGVDSPRLDAELLLADALSLERIGLFLDPDRPLSQSELGAYKLRMKRREAREPVAYIVGRKDFWKDTFVVNRHVLIPRPETETVLEGLLGHCSDRGAAWDFLEVGCGSGALLLSLLREFPNATGVGLDLSREAIDTSKLNGQRLGVHHRVQWVWSDLFAGLSGVHLFDAIVANPPYIVGSQLPDLAPEIFYHEPRLALDGGVDGLDVIRRLVPAAFPFLKSGGMLAVEIDSRQQGDVVALFETSGFKAVRTLEDCHHLPRVVFGVS